MGLHAALMAVSSRQALGALDAALRASSVLARAEDARADAAALADLEATADQAALAVATARLRPDIVQDETDGRRAAVFPLIPDAVTLSERLNIRHRPTLAALGASAPGVRPFVRIPDERPIDLRHIKCCSRRPPVRKLRNAFSAMLR